MPESHLKWLIFKAAIIFLELAEIILANKFSLEQWEFLVLLRHPGSLPRP
jgi:hypothetical protein